MHKSLMSIVAATSIFGAAVTTSTKVEAGCRGCRAGAAIAGGPVTIYGYAPYYGFAPAYYYCYAKTLTLIYTTSDLRYYAPPRYVCTAARP